jgi:hypothetical protein
MQMLQQIIKTWESRRIIYNVVMLPLGVIIIQKLLAYGMPVRPALMLALTSGLTANAFYSLGPLVDLYMALFKPAKDLGKWRPVLFGLGLSFSLLVEALFLWGLCHSSGRVSN